jgi:hypothetical protein
MRMRRGRGWRFNGKILGIKGRVGGSWGFMKGARTGEQRDQQRP